jgi:DNA-directed RNA polymerase specialized sigma24 family protein
MMRYFFDTTPSDIALRQGCGESRIKMKLLRTRKKLAEYLRKEGIIV